MKPLDRLHELCVYHAFLSVPASRYPDPPFHLNPWTRVNDSRWFQSLRSEVIAACHYLEGKTDRPHPRQRTGAILTDLRYLKPLLKP